MGGIALELLALLSVLLIGGLILLFARDTDEYREKANPYRAIGESVELTDPLVRKISVLLHERLRRLQVLVRNMTPQLKVGVPITPGSQMYVHVEISNRMVTIWNEGNSENIHLKQNEGSMPSETSGPRGQGLEAVVDYFDQKLLLQDLTLELGLDGPSHWESWEELDGDEERVIEFIEDFEGRKSMRPIEAEILADNIVFSLDCLLDSGEDATAETEAVKKFVRKHVAEFPSTLQDWLNRSEKEYPASGLVRALVAQGQVPDQKPEELRRATTISNISQKEAKIPKWAAMAFWVVFGIALIAMVFWGQSRV